MSGIFPIIGAYTPLELVGCAILVVTDYTYLLGHGQPIVLTEKQQLHVLQSVISHLKFH